ncbi:MAG: Fic family protein [Ruminococcus sp.]|nr:Fic family protein [Ruminococcus sp.]
MKYKSFSKLFHSNKEEYEERIKYAKLDHCYFELDINIGENKAFFFATPEIFEMIIEIERISNKLMYYSHYNNLYKDMQLFLMNGFIIDEIKSTNNIEGIRSSRKDINDVMTRAKSNKRLQGMVNRYRMLAEQEKIKITSSKDIRKIYDELVSDEVYLTDPDDAPDGVIFRKRGVGIIGNDGKVIHEGLMPESEIIETMDKALDFLYNGKVHYLIKVAVFHYLFGYIHPFYDGNGRVNRFISSYLLNYKTFNLFGFRLSYIINKNLPAYYKAFQTVDNPQNLGDVTPFIITFLDLIKKAANNTESVIVGSIDKFKMFHENIYKLPSSSEKLHDLYAMLIAVTLFSETGTTREEITQKLGISTATLVRRLSEIPETLLNIRKVGKVKYFSLNYDELMTIINS